MDLATTYMGIKLPHPIMPGAGPMVEDLDTVKRMEDAGAAAIVMNSLFEEQINLEEQAAHENLEVPAESFAEALSYFPQIGEYRLGSEEYMAQIRKIKEAVAIPVIGSLNGVTSGGWLNHAKDIVSAGADALELNVYFLATRTDEDAAAIEQRTIEMVRNVKSEIKIPVAVKLSPFYTSLPNIASKLADAGVDGLVLFNRFYQPDLNVEDLEVDRSLELSTSSELRLRLRWLAILSGRVNTSLAVTGGIHTPLDAVKAVLCGAGAIQTVSAILQKGPQIITQLIDGLADWLEQHEYESLEQGLGSMNLMRSPDPSAYERANYAHILQRWSR
jgi:dihydroorotate dehydrogenase (fumarate)